MKTLIKILNEFNIFEMLIIGFICMFLLDMWKWFELNHHTLTNQSGGVYGSLVLLIGGCLKMALTNIMARWDKNHAD